MNLTINAVTDEEKKAAKKAYYEKYKLEICNKQKAYYQSNKAFYSDYQKSYRKENKDKRKIYHENNKDRINFYDKCYRKRHCEELKVKDKIRRQVDKDKRDFELEQWKQSNQVIVETLQKIKLEDKIRREKENNKRQYSKNIKNISLRSNQWKKINADKERVRRNKRIEELKDDYVVDSIKKQYPEISTEEIYNNPLMIMLKRVEIKSKRFIKNQES